MDTRYGSWDYGKALPQEPKILLIDGVTKKWQPEWAATCVICTQEMSAYRLANPQPCRRTAQVMAGGEKMILKTPVCQLLFYFF